MSITSHVTNRKRGPHFKLSRAQGEQVKSAYESTSATVEEIARKSGVTKQTIYNVLKRLHAEEHGMGDPRWK